MTTALSTAPTKIFQFHSSIFPCYKELRRRPFFSSLSSSSAKQNQVSMGLLSYQLRRLCLWVVWIQSRRRKSDSERLQSALLKTAVLWPVIDRYRNVIKLCHFMVNLHSVLHSVWSWYLWKTLTAPLETDETKGSWIVEDSCVSAIMSPPMSGWYGIYQ